MQRLSCQSPHSFIISLRDILSIPQDAGDTDVTLTDTGTGAFMTTTFTPGDQLILFPTSGEQLHLRAVTEQGFAMRALFKRVFFPKTCTSCGESVFL